ncbi:HotDog domain-containing protein [Filobasidium floriforme]|uniref:HotDog domain-containing protein n=1 Tax=Filobasidium floriforme TaxID=5210 RepID=UPI001E8D7293|nr:HotDog domain-containing protein [Filobasidium floriforme]KAH8082289.1 HotDog domain-containing protein [Filobasidium floriforme]
MSWYTRPLCGLRSGFKVIDTRSTLPKAYGSRAISRLTHHNRTTVITKPATILSPSDGVRTKRWEHGSRSIPSQKRASSTYTNIALLLVLPSTFYLLGSIYPPATLSLLFPRKAPAPMRVETPEGQAHVERLEQEIQKLDLVQQLREKTAGGDAAEWYECRPASKPMHEHSLTSSILRGPGMLAVPPLAFVKTDESEAVLILHLGRSLCGHDGIIHGGMIATIFDEALGRNALLNIPSNIGVTATLNMQYKKPTKADQFVVIRTKFDSVNGRKVNVSGTMEDLQGETLAMAQAMFVEPSYAKYLSNSGVAAALGRRPEILDTAGRLKDEKKIDA